MSRAARLAELRALRQAGKTAFSTYQVKEAEDIYDEVDEDGYKKKVRERLDRDDFVIDDNGAGYADDGREELDGRHYDSMTESEEEIPLKGKAAKRKREEEKEKMEKANNSINKYFNSNSSAQIPRAKPKIAIKADDVAFMADILGEVDAAAVSNRLAPTKTIKSENRRKVRILSPPIEAAPKHVRSKAAVPATPHTPDENAMEDDDTVLPPLDNEDVMMSDPAPSSPISKAVERKIKAAAEVEDEDDDAIEVSQAVGNHGVKGTSVNISGSRPAPKIIKKEPPYPTPESSSPTRPPADTVDASAWNNVTAKLNVLSSSGETASYGKVKVDDAIEADGSIRMFWTDYTEVNGSLCLFGKVRVKSSGKFVSAFTKVDNILRKLYFLPRTYKRKNGRDTTEEVGMEDVYEEVDGILTKQRVGTHKIKPCQRKYAFEKADIPKDAEYLKCLYPYDKPALPIDLHGDTFSTVFGTNTALFEQFVLWKNIMGPCWLKIDAGAFAPVGNASWCKLELSVADPKAIAPLSDSDNLDAPPLTFMSLSFRTILNVKENKQEMLAVSARVYENTLLTDTTPADKLPCKSFTIIRPIEQSFPIGFDAACKKQRSTICLERSEQMLLAKFLAMLEKIDPDVLMGHGLQDVDYPVLLSRMKERKTHKWHRIGRLQRSDWPKSMGKGGGSFFAERQLVAGRLLCDIANDMGKSLMTKCQSWSMTEMCSLYLGDGAIRQEVDNEVALKTWATTREGLLNYVNHCEADTYFIAAIALRVQMLPLSKVLTNLAGNSWARTLSGTRAERNEYILLHEFHKNKYICPDKVYGKSKQKNEDELAEGEDGVDAKKKDKYKGGLVFEPEKGLYDKFILVMDFNSLYPSIIQEYNICFTTVDRTEVGDEEEKIPEVPTDQDQGILPKLIATLVKRRREVKKLMKDPRASPEELATWDIKQLALKLTANSMYGCLGYTQSRFYARPLAMLTTFKGREILTSTKDLAESSQLRVIYGDTDSVMINTNADSIEEALKVGNEFKRSVNDRYRLLEIDIDNVFRRLLLHAKKKYAAINLLEVDGKYVEKLEVKGLDMKRREYCALSKEASSRLLNEILSGEDPEVVITKIHEYLRELSQQMREEKVPNQKYIIYTKLGKDPRAYPNPDSMPQVQVALRALASGKSVRVNDVISYITCLPSSGPSTTDSNSTSNTPKATTPAHSIDASTPAPKRAFSLLDVSKSAGTLKPDIDWYLTKQIFPPIERLCAPIPGTNSGQLAECLGLDARKFSSSAGSSSGAFGTGAAWDMQPLDSQLPDSVRYRDCPRLSLRCLSCREPFIWEGLASPASKGYASPRGLRCPRPECGAGLKTLALVAQVEAQVRGLAGRYYDGWLVCDEPTCGARTRSMSVYGHRCLGPGGLARGCLGRMGPEVGGKVVGNTLGYWRGLWDVERGSEGGNGGASGSRSGSGSVSGNGKDGEEGERVRALRTVEVRRAMETVKGVVEGYERKCGWVWVQMDGLFGWALK